MSLAIFANNISIIADAISYNHTLTYTHLLKDYRRNIQKSFLKEIIENLSIFHSGFYCPMFKSIISSKRYFKITK